jgi:hypothetical protein
MTRGAALALSKRLQGLPGRAWCALCHRRLWKVWRVIDSRHGYTWIAYRCRVCWREFVCPRA